MAANRIQKLASSGTLLVAAETAVQLTHAGAIGTICGLAAGLAGYMYADEIVGMVGGALAPSTPEQHKEADEPATKRDRISLAYRLINGKSTREQDQVMDDDIHTEPLRESTEQDEITLPVTRKQRGLFTLSQLLAEGFTPSLDRIFLGRKSDGTTLTAAVSQLCHIALPGSTGHGKSSLLRLIMAQLCSVGVQVILLNPHYMIYDREHDEDWTPFDAYLRQSALECKDYPAIQFYLDQIANVALEQRKERAAHGGKIGKPFFCLVDEVPAVVKNVPDASENIGKILREGRKYNIFLICASQDFAVKTLGVEGEGSVRKCFQTILYVGGDPISAKELLGTKDNTTLGKGTAMLRALVQPESGVVYVPYTDNEGLYRLLGPSTFFLSAEDDQADDVPTLLEPEPVRQETSSVAVPTQRFSSGISPELRRGLDAYQAGATSFRKLGEALGIDKDAAGRMIKLLKAKGLID